MYRADWDRNATETKLDKLFSQLEYENLTRFI